MSPVALITGASAGIGSALAREYANRGHDLVLVARRLERLEALGEELTAAHGCRCTPIAADLALPEAPAELAARLEALAISVDVLVNNAGYGVTGSLLSNPWETHRDFLQVMVTAVTELCWRFAGPMRERGAGRIVNIASLAGHMPGTAGHTLYGAVKAWMIRFSESLSFELDRHGVTVTAVCPGFTYTEFHDVNAMRDKVSQMPDYMWMSAEDVARQAVDASEGGRRIFINGRFNRFVALLPRVLPRPLMYRLMARQSRNFRDEG